MSIIKTVFLLSAIFILGITASNSCIEVVKIADVVINRLKLDFSLNNFEKISEDLGHIQNISRALGTACPDLIFDAPESMNKYPCSSIQFFVKELFLDYSYGAAIELDGQENVAFILLQLLSLVNNTKESDCLIEWAAHSLLDGIEPSTGDVHEGDKQSDDNNTLTIDWWLDPNSYNNTHIDELITNAFDTMGVNETVNASSLEKSEAVEGTLNAAQLESQKIPANSTVEAADEKALINSENQEAKGISNVEGTEAINKDDQLISSDEGEAAKDLAVEDSNDKFLDITNNDDDSKGIST